MGFIQDKESLFSQIAVVKALQENFPKLNKSSQTFSSVTDVKGNLIPLFLDLLRNLVDSSEIKSELDRFLAKSDSFEGKVKNIISNTLLDTYAKNFNFNVPTGVLFSTNIKNLDIDQVVNVDPNTELGKFYYGNNSNTDFNRVLRQASQTGSGNFANILTLNFNTTETVEVSVNPNYNNLSFEDYVNDVLDNTKLIEPSTLVSKILDNSFGSVSSLSEKGYEWFLDQTKRRKMIDKIIDKESLTEGTVIYNDDFFKFTKSEMDEIRNKANSLYNGVNRSDLGCGFGENFIDLKSFSNSFNDLNDIRPSLVREAIVKTTSELIKQSTVGISEENRKNVEFNIISDIFTNLPAIFTSLAFSPLVITLFQSAERLTNNLTIDFQTDSIDETPSDRVIRLLREPFICIIKQIYGLIVEFLFDRVKSELIKLARILVSKIITDQTENYQKILEVIKDIRDKIENIFSLINGSD
jgi:hypothetical protein